eukprot:12239055-Alexandrium_andersonii.AAC.1
MATRHRVYDPRGTTYDVLRSRLSQASPQKHTDAMGRAHTMPYTQHCTMRLPDGGASRYLSCLCV